MKTKCQEHGKQLGIYIHIPFCVKKCAYCDFLSAPADENVREEYIRQLLREIEQFTPDAAAYTPDTVFIGGGTPSILTGEQIQRIMNKVREVFDRIKDGVREVTIEANPKTLTREKLYAYKEAGINRVSIGLQSADNKELSMLGRIHTWEDFQKTYSLVREIGIRNINIDVMSALPGQTLESYQKTLKQAVSLQPEHISAYSLIIEEGTAFYNLYQEDEYRRQMGEPTVWLPDEEQERRMYEWTKEFLAQKGYQRYEISNYARAGFECMHNAGYWKRKEYIGFGLGAASLLHNRRFSQCRELAAYLEGKFSRCGEQQLGVPEQMEEFMFLGLRLTKGVSKAEFYREFQTELEAVYADVLSGLIRDGLVIECQGRIMLTERGTDISNYVFEQFLLEY